MAEQLNYQPVSFEGIVPQLDVGDPSQSFVASMQGAIAGEEANLQQMARNAEIENINLKTKLDGLQSLAQFSGKAFETYTKISNENLKDRLAQVWAERVKNFKTIDIAPYEQDEAEARNVQKQIGEQTAEELNKDKEPDVQKIAAAGQFRKYSNLEAVTARNADAYLAMQSYGPALETWLSKIPNLSPEKYQDAVDEFNRRWAKATNLAGVNEQFSAKYVYPEINKQVIKQKDQFTRQWNVRHAEEQGLLLDQQFAEALRTGVDIDPDSYFKQLTGLTKSDGRTLQTYEDGWARLSKMNLSPDQLTKFGEKIFKLTGKPYSSHPRFQSLLRDARQRLLNEDRLKNAQYSLDSRDGFRALGPNATQRDMEVERDRQLALGIPSDIVDSNLGTARRSSFEAGEIREWTDKITTWLNNNPDQKIPYDVIADAPFQVKQQFRSQMEPNANAATTEELLRKSQAFKDIEKDMKATLKQIIPEMEIASSAMGTTDPVNFNAFKSAQLTNIVQRAQVLMLGQSSLSLEDALQQAKQQWQADTTKLQAEGKLFNKDKNEFRTAPIHVGQAQAARMMAQQLQKTELGNLAEGLYESDYTQPPVQGRYSERVRFLARRYGMRPKEIVDLARQQQGLDPLPSTGADNTLGMVSKGEMSRIASLDSSSVTAALRAQINSGQRLTGDAKSKTIAVGQQLQAMGIKGIWQHPDFNYDSGYTGSGKERVGGRAGNSYHKYDEALDIGVNGNGERKLDMLYAYLMKNKERFGVAELLWRTEGHYDHLHVSFK